MAKPSCAALVGMEDAASGCCKHNAENKYFTWIKERSETHLCQGKKWRRRQHLRLILRTGTNGLLGDEPNDTQHWTHTDFHLSSWGMWRLKRAVTSLESKLYVWGNQTWELFNKVLPKSSCWRSRFAVLATDEQVACISGNRTQCLHVSLMQILLNTSFHAY